MRWATSLCAILCTITMSATTVRGQDSNKLTEISAEQARDLVAKSVSGVVSLNGLTTLSPEVAAALGQSSVPVIWLNGLTTLSPEVASMLVEHEKRSLSLNGLTTLSPETAVALARQKGSYLNLNGLTTLSPEVAAALAKSSVAIYLNGLTTLSPEVALELARYQGKGIFLNGIRTLQPEAAQTLANQDRVFLFLRVLLPNQETTDTITFTRSENKSAAEKKETDSATVKLEDKVPQLFYRGASSEEFNTPGPKLPAGTDDYGRRLQATCWSFSPNGKLIAVGSGYRAGRGSDPDDPICLGEIRVWEVATGKLVSSAGEKYRLGAIKKVVFSEDSKTVYFNADQYADR